MTRLLRRSCYLLLAFVALAAAGDSLSYDAPAWGADLDRLEADMAQGYANLDWIAEKRGLDLVRLDRETRARLGSAHSHLRAFLALRDFLHAFHDPHLRLEWGERPIRESQPAQGLASDTKAKPPVSSLAGPDCSEAGYEEGEHAFAFPFQRLAGWRTLADGDFPAGIAGDTGVLRIAQLGENQYLSACEQVVHRGPRALDARGLQLAVRALQQTRLRAALAALRQAGARRLLIDVSGNGGGSEWVSEVIALATPRTMTRAPVRVVAPSCDRRGAWRGKPGCSVFGPPGERETIRGTGAWSGPVFVLADRNTASAAEDLVAWLQQNRVARVIGERTMGAGCGYVDGGTRTQLRNSPFDVMMPNCARYLDDGSNEIEGIAPDIALDMQSTDEAGKAQALAAALNRSDLIQAREARLD
jgi:hypothetical protein